MDLVKPVCPYCGVEMKQIEFIGCWDHLHYWKCGCTELPEATTEYV